MVLRACKACGAIFLARTQGKYCHRCRANHILNHVRYKNLKADPIRLKYTRLQQRIQHREPVSSPYKKWFESLAVNNKNESWLNEMSELDKKYKSVKKTYVSCGFSSAEEKWYEEFKCANLVTLADLREWLDDVTNLIRQGR